MLLPLSLHSHGDHFLCVGGGRAAAQKLELLARLVREQGPDCGPPHVTVVAPAMAEGLAQLAAGHPFASLSLLKRRFRAGDLGGKRLVYAFTDDPRLNARIARLCARRGVLSNVAGQRQAGFSSPAVVQSGGQLVAVASLPSAGPAPDGAPGGRQDPRASRELAQRIGAFLAAARKAAPEPAVPGAPHYMPFMLGLGRVLVFGGERGEGLQKTEKLGLFARELLVVPEADPAAAQPGAAAPAELVFPPGPVRLAEAGLAYREERRVPLNPRPAAWELDPAHPERLDALLSGVDYVCSDLADPLLNRLLHAACRARGVRHTVVDTKELSDTWFMGLVDAPPLLGAVSSRGACAFYAKKLREELEDFLGERAVLARVLTSLRAALPRAERQAGLEAAWRDPAFRAKAARGEAPEAWARVAELLASPLPPWAALDDTQTTAGHPVAPRGDT